MSWLSRLSFKQAVRYALLWPITVLGAAGGVWYAAMARGAVVTVRLEPAGSLSLWLALTLVAAVALLGPPAVFLAAWTLARR
jgi:hypothetical protein